MVVDPSPDLPLPRRLYDLHEGCDRVLEELLRMLESGASQPFIELINQHGMLDYLLPEVAHFIAKEDEGDDIYAYLSEVDTIFKDPTEKKLNRSVLLSTMAFPLLEHRLDQHFLSREKIPHLGQIDNHARDMIHDVFQSFFLVPRRLKVEMHNILTGQYRLTPLHKRKMQKRIPKGSDFDLALSFLNMRSCLEPALQNTFNEWHEAYTQTSGGDEEERRKRRPRRRPRGRTRGRKRAKES